MARRARLHIAGGVYYVCQRGKSDEPIFTGPEDYTRFEALLQTVLQRCEARIHAYCWTPNSLHLLVQPGRVPIGQVMQRLTCQYARKSNRLRCQRGRLFRQRYRAALIDPDKYLLRLVVYIHRAPIRAELTQNIDNFPFSSHQAYLGVSTVRWLHTDAVNRQLILSSADGRKQAYRHLMNDDLFEEEERLFERGSRRDRRVIGGEEFVANLPREGRPYRATVSLDRIIQSVIHRFGLDFEQVVSRSRRRELVLARALTAWYATERRIATLSDVARRLQRDPSTLYVAVERYRAARPELFNLSALQDLSPLIPIPDKDVQSRNLKSTIALSFDARAGEAV